MTTSAPDRLALVVRVIENHVAAGGWDQDVQLFALVPTADIPLADLAADSPSLADALLSAPADDSGLTSVLQEDLPPHGTLEDLLATIGWPEQVAGAALVVHRIVLPPEVEDELPADEQEALAYLAEHPLREEVRLAVAVLRDGTTATAMRFRSHDDPVEVLTGADLAPGLTAALASTLEP